MWKTSVSLLSQLSWLSAVCELIYSPCFKRHHHVFASERLIRVILWSEQRPESLSDQTWVTTSRLQRSIQGHDRVCMKKQEHLQPHCTVFTVKYCPVWHHRGACVIPQVSHTRCDVSTDSSSLRYLSYRSISLETCSYSEKIDLCHCKLIQSLLKISSV